MSTKIYEAFRMKAPYLNGYLTKTRQKVMKRVGRHVADLVLCADSEYAEKVYQKKYPNGHNPDFTKDSVLNHIKWEELVLPEIQRASTSLTRDLKYGIDCSLNIWYHKGYFYIMPVGEYWITELIKKPSYAQDYAYWNNTDRPKNVSEKEWREREKTWDELCIEDHNRTRMNHKIIDFDQTAPFKNLDWEFYYHYVEPLIRFKAK